MAIRHLGYEVVVATTGEEAVERASAMLPDLILMDIGLPKLTGAEAVVRIKGDPTTKHIPIVILSALRMCPDIKRALKAGAAEIVQKPVSVLKIREILSKHLSIGAGGIHTANLLTAVK
jgi:two-component system cell cycle response regulator DivK